MGGRGKGKAGGDAGKGAGRRATRDVRAGKPRALWTAEAEALLATKLTNAAIARQVGCHESTVKARRGPRRGPAARGTAKPVSDQPAPVAAAIRVAHAQSLICKMPTVDILVELRERFGVDEVVARDDVATARAQLMADSVAERPAIRAMCTAMLRQDRLDARKAGQYAAAVAAVREIGKLHGAYEPDKVTVVPHESLELGAIISVLNEVEKAALDVVLEGIERAKATGRLPLALPPGPSSAASGDSVNAELVDDGAVRNRN